MRCLPFTWQSMTPMSTSSCIVDSLGTSVLSASTTVVGAPMHAATIAFIYKTRRSSAHCKYLHSFCSKGVASERWTETASSATLREA